jgi:hypothetical protein
MKNRAKHSGIKAFAVTIADLPECMDEKQGEAFRD